MVLTADIHYSISINFAVEGVVIDLDYVLYILEDGVPLGVSLLDHRQAHMAVVLVTVL